MQQLLHQTKGTQPAADHSSEQKAVQQQYATHIEQCTAVSTERALEGSQGTCAHSTGAGITVDTGGAELLGAALVDIACYEAPEIGVKQQRKIQLHQLPLGGKPFFDFRDHSIHIFYPSPTHSVQILMALVSTSAVPPEIRP